MIDLFSSITAVQLPREMEAYLSAAILAHHPTYDTSRTPPVDLKPAVLTASTAPKYSLGKGNGFPTQRRPMERPITSEHMEKVEAWFQDSGITIGSMADTPEKVVMSKCMLYTWRECFAKSVRDIKPTDLIEHSIDLEAHARPIKTSLPRYTAEEREFANRIFPELEDAGIIVRRSSPWGHRTKFPPKKKDSPLLRVVHNFIPVNSFTIKSGYPMHHLEEVINTLIKPHFIVFFSSDASNGYWAIPMKWSDINKTGFIAPNGQWVYLRMGQGLKGGPHTYAQFSDLVFGPLPANSAGVARMPSLIGTHGDHAFQVFMDDHAAAATTFEEMFKFLHEEYFPRVAFGPVYLSGHKTVVFGGSLELLGFHGSADGLRPSIKHREKIQTWPTPANRAELDAFLWLTPFLRIFIPGRAAHVLEMKKAYLELVAAEPKAKKVHDDEVEPCDEDLTKALIRKARPKKPTIQRKYVEKDSFDWGPNQQKSFDEVKAAITNNAMSGADPDLQFHLAVDASEEAVGGCLFQLQGQPAGTEASPKFLPNERIIMFLSFRLNDAESRYVNSERECLAIVRCLAEVRWIVIGSKYPVKVYSDHDALMPIFTKGQTEKGRISNWMDRLGEYDFQLVYRPSRDQHIGIADGLSRMPTRLSSISKAEDQDRMAMAVFDTTNLEQQTGPRGIREQVEDRMEKYASSPMYHQLIQYMRGGEAAIGEMQLPRNRQRYLREASKRYRLPESHESQILRYTENTGAESICLIEAEVHRFLHAAHEDHGHHAAALTLDFLMGRAYWPTRVKDVHTWVQNCHSCQARSKRPIKTSVQAIQHFAPLSMLGMDWIGPISPPCSITGAVYILLVMDYFSRFAWAKAYIQHTAVEVIDMYENHITPVFGWPIGVYSDNGSHFVNGDVNNMFTHHGVSHFTGPISHPSSTGLLERGVQEMMTFISKKCIDRRAHSGWSLMVREGVLEMNTKGVRIHGYSPSQLMLGFEPQLYHFDINPAPLPTPAEAEEELPPYQYQIFTALRDENKLLSAEAASYTHYRQGKNTRKQKIPAPGDLVLVWDAALAKQHGRKLERKWMGPRMLTKLTPHGLSGYVREIHGDGREKRYHINDLILYHQREEVMLAGAQLTLPPQGTTPVIIGGSRITTGRVGGRALMLYQLYQHH